MHVSSLRRRRGAFVAAAVLVVFGGSACGHTQAATPAPAAAAPSAPAASSPEVKRQAPGAARIPTEAPELPPGAKIGDYMGDHFVITSWARDAVIAGTLDPMRGPLTALAEYRYPDLPPGGWEAPIAQLQAAARLTSKAESLEVAAMGVATMARVCGECHEKTHGGPALPPPPDSADYYDADTLDERMGRHMWASELLWEGLTGPSDVSWKAGADRLIQAPAQLDDVLPVNFDGELRRVQAIGQSASEASTLTARADVYGLLIATCAQCHSRWLQHEDE